MPDPANPQSLNRYSCVLNNPLLYTDPSGHRECGPACEGDVTSVNNIDPCLGTACFGYWFSGDEWGRGWTAQDTETVLFTVLALAGGMAAPEVIAAVPGAIEAVGWKALSTLLGWGGTAAGQELLDGDDDEIRAARAAREVVIRFVKKSHYEDIIRTGRMKISGYQSYATTLEHVRNLATSDPARIADALGIPPERAEYYVVIARRVLDRAGTVRSESLGEINWLFTNPPLEKISLSGYIVDVGHTARNLLTVLENLAK